MKWQEKALVLYTDEEDREEGRTRLRSTSANKPYHEEVSGQ